MTCLLIAMIKLREIKTEDLPTLLAWRNSPDLNKYFRQTGVITKESHYMWHRSLVNSNTHYMRAIMIKKTFELVGVCGLCYLDDVNKRAEISLYIGKNNEYIDSHGYSDHALNILCNLGFIDFGLRKIWTDIIDYDEKKQKLLERHGFKKVKTLKRRYLKGISYRNAYLYEKLNKKNENNRREVV